MKDRLKHTNRKKPSHILRNASIFMVALTSLSLLVFIPLLSKYSKMNLELSKQIDNYTYEVDRLENQNAETLQKLNQKNP